MMKSGPAPISSEPGSSEKTGCNSTLHLYTDGASRGNPGEGGAGIVLMDDQGGEILSRGYYLGLCTNNEAEYKALIHGLTEAAKTGCNRLIIFLDSELIVRQINGIYKVKAPTLKPLFSKVRKLLQSFESYSIQHVPRAENSRADSLANQGIDQAGRR